MISWIVSFVGTTTTTRQTCCKTESFLWKNVTSAIKILQLPLSGVTWKVSIRKGWERMIAMIAERFTKPEQGLHNTRTYIVQLQTFRKICLVMPASTKQVIKTIWRITKPACMTCNQVFGSATSIPAKRNQNPSLIATYWKNIKRSTLMFFVQCAKDFLVQCGIWRSISRVLTSLPPMLRLLKTRMNRTMTRTLTQVQLTSRLRSF